MAENEARARVIAYSNVVEYGLRQIAAHTPKLRSMASPHMHIAHMLSGLDELRDMLAEIPAPTPESDPDPWHGELLDWARTRGGTVTFDGTGDSGYVATVSLRDRRLWQAIDRDRDTALRRLYEMLPVGGD